MSAINRDRSKGALVAAHSLVYRCTFGPVRGPAFWLGPWHGPVRCLWATGGPARCRPGPWAAPSARSTVVARPGQPVARRGPPRAGPARSDRAAGRAGPARCTSIVWYLM